MTDIYFRFLWANVSVNPQHRIHSSISSIICKIYISFRFLWQQQLFTHSHTLSHIPPSPLHNHLLINSLLTIFIRKVCSGIYVCVYVCVGGWMVGFFLSTSGDNCRTVLSFSGLIFRLVSLNKTCTKKTLNISKKYELLRHNNGHRWMMHYICSTGSIRKEHRTNKRRGTPLSILTEWILYNSRMKCWKNYWRISKKMFSVSEAKRRRGEQRWG